MNDTRLIFKIIVFIFLTLIPFRQASAEIFNRVVAIVNDDVITLYELNKKIVTLTGETPVNLKLKGEGRYLEIRRQILELLIDERIAQDKIQEMGIRISQRRTEGAIERIKRENQWTEEDLLASLKNQGMTIEQYKEEIRKDLERMELINRQVRSKIVIREEEIEKYYREHESMFKDDDRVQLSGIFLLCKDPNDDEEMRALKTRGEDILSELRKGKDFGALAKKYSQGPGANEGGNLGAFKTAQIDPTLREVVKSLPEGGHSGLIKRPTGYQIIMLTKKETGQVKTIEEAKDAIYSTLYKEEIDQLYTSWIKELRENSYTKIIF